MTALLRRLGRSRLAQAAGANLVVQLVQVTVQLAAVPILATHWGLRTYGIWLLLFTIPSYLAMADLGLASAAGNDMTASVARGERARAIATYQALRLTVLLVAGIVFAAAALVIYGLVPHLLDGMQAAAHGQARGAFLLLVAYGLMSLQNSVAFAGLRAVGSYTAGVYITAGMFAAEAIAALTVVVYGGGIAAAALAYLLLRTAGSVAMSGMLAVRARWLVTLKWQSSRAVLRRLLRPAVAVMALPIAQAISLQGTVLVVGAAAGPSAIPAFTAVRTLSRVAVQCILIVNHALMPSFTAAAAIDDAERRTRLATISMITSFLFVLPAFFVLTLGGRFIVGVWTHDSVHPALSLIVVMACMMVVNAIWQPLSNLILSINRHESYSYHYLLVSVLMIAAAYPLVRLLGATGAAVSLLLLDLVMLRHVMRIARALHVVNGAHLRATIGRSLAWRPNPRRR